MKINNNQKTNALKLHKKYKGKLFTGILTPVKTKADLSLVYTPGVADVSMAIAKNKSQVYDYTIKGHTVAVITDGSAVLGLGNIGAEASLPVMEGKAALFKTFAGLDAFPIALNTQDSTEIIQAIKAIAPVFGGINLEDISAPRCFEIEDALQDIGIPVMHDDQHGTAVVVLAGLINAFKVANKDLAKAKIVLLGAGAAGSGIAKILANLVGELIMVDSKGIVSLARTDLDPYKVKLAQITNKRGISGSLQDALVEADCFIGVSKANLLTTTDIKSMAKKPIIFALANPNPEILPSDAKSAGAFIVATGRSDFPNQVNNSLVFPGIFKGALASKATKITDDMKVRASYALANAVKNPNPDKIIPEPFDKGIADIIALAVATA